MLDKYKKRMASNMLIRWFKKINGGEFNKKGKVTHTLYFGENINRIIIKLFKQNKP